MPDELSDLVKETLASPLGDVIASVGEGVASAQRALDEGSLAMTLAIYGEGGDETLRVLRDIGYRPTFYALPETTGEVHVSLRLSGAGGSGAASPTAPGSAAADTPRIGAQAIRSLPAVRAYATPVDAGFANRYGYSAAASAKLTFKIVPVPPPAGVEDVRAVPALGGRTVEVVRGVMEALELGVRFLDAAGQVVAEPDPGVKVRATDATVPVAGAVVRLGTVVDATLEPS